MKMDDVRRVVCQRCGLDMRVMVQTPNPEVTLMRFSDSGEGLCASCAATLFLYSVEHIKRLIEAKPEMLLWAPMQDQFAALMETGQADASPGEINWQHLKEHWSLPFPKRKRQRKKP